MCVSSNLSISHKLPNVFVKLIILPSYSFNVCRIWSDVPSLSFLVLVICVFPLLLLINLARGLPILSTCSKNQPLLSFSSLLVCFLFHWFPFLFFLFFSSHYFLKVIEGHGFPLPSSIISNGTSEWKGILDIILSNPFHFIEEQIS